MPQRHTYIIYIKCHRITSNWSINCADKASQLTTLIYQQLLTENSFVYYFNIKIIVVPTAVYSNLEFEHPLNKICVPVVSIAILSISCTVAWNLPKGQILTSKLQIILINFSIRLHCVNLTEAFSKLIHKLKLRRWGSNECKFTLKYKYTLRRNVFLFSLSKGILITCMEANLSRTRNLGQWMYSSAFVICGHSNAGQK